MGQRGEQGEPKGGAGRRRWLIGRRRPPAADAAEAAPPHRRTRTGRLAWAVGCIGLILALNYGAGWTWDQAFPTTHAATPPPAADVEPAYEVVGKLPRDPRTDVPAMAAYPWREPYFDEIQRTTIGYWPFTEYRPRDFSGTYVHQDGWIRRSYEPAGKADTMPTMWMYGGSTTWGEGQRDDFTIASWIARLSEQAGTPLRVENYGQRGWTHFQEMVLYEQELALQPPPDLAVFYDGANELIAQSLIDEAAPTHVLAYFYAKKLTGTTVATKLVDEPASDPDLWPMVRAEYQEHSAVEKIIGWFQGPADAAPRQDPAATTTTTTTAATSEPGGPFTGDQELGENGDVSHYDVTLQDGIDAGRVYRRGKLLTLAASREHDVDTYLFWQPIRFDGEAQKRARAEMGSSTIDISDALVDHPEVFIDGGHTNEEGARIVAERIWRSIAPAVEEWYDHAN